ncbi:MAG: TetR/AcrR family transcriptional regulator [Bacteroidota bacterium]
MAKKKIKKEDLITKYMEHVLDNGTPPASVFKFAKTHGFQEADFYQFFGSFEALQQAIFVQFFQTAETLLDKNDDYQSFDARNKLLSFYYTFFELLTANRSYVLVALDSHRDHLKNIKTLSPLKKAFTQYIAGLDIDTIDLKQEQVEKFQQRSLQESAWIQLVLILKFWLDDTSPAFEKTDIFIEKSINTSFDVLDVQPLRSLIDLGKFLFKEKIQMS